MILSSRKCGFKTIVSVMKKEDSEISWLQFNYHYLMQSFTARICYNFPINNSEVFMMSDEAKKNDRGSHISGMWGVIAAIIGAIGTIAA